MLRTLLAWGFEEEARWLQHVAAVAADLVLPPPTSAQNTEVLGMSAAVLFGTFDPDLPTEEAYEQASLAEHLCDAAFPHFLRAGLLEVELDDRGLRVVLPGIQKFLGAWREGAFPRLEVSHKLAAALCLTEIPDADTLHSPWRAWSLLVPNGLLGDAQPQRVWCVGAEPRYLVSKTGAVTGWSEEHAGGAVAADMLRSLVRGACVVLSDPERKRTEGRWGTPAAAPHTRAKRPTGTAPEGARYVLAQPVTIDLRDTVTEAITGKRRGGSPKVQFLVRGHLTHQAHGPRHSLRRVQWIEPFWKGDPAARVLLRGHRVQDAATPEKPGT